MGRLQPTRRRVPPPLARIGIALALFAALVPLHAAAQTLPVKKDPVVATVNGEKILLSDLMAAHRDLPARLRRIPFARLYRPLLARAIDIKLIAAAGRKADLHKEASVVRRVSRYEERLIQQLYVRRLLAGKISEETVKERYKEFLKTYKPVDEVRASHILVRTEEEAKEIIKQLEGGADFAKLAREKSIGPSKARGGDLGYFTRDRMVKVFADAAFALKKGEITKQPVKSRFGYHVIKLTDRRKRPAPGYAKIRQRLRDDLSQKLLGDELKKLRADTKIEQFKPDGTPLQD